MSPRRQSATCPECGLPNVDVVNRRVALHLREGVPLKDPRSGCGFPVELREGFRLEQVAMLTPVISGSAMTPRRQKILQVLLGMAVGALLMGELLRAANR